MSRFWLHCRHLFVDGKKMSKSTGNIIYLDNLLNRGYSKEEIRFYLIYGHYGKQMNFREDLMAEKTKRLRAIRACIEEIGAKAGQETDPEEMSHSRIEDVFRQSMDDDLNVKKAFDGIASILEGISFERLRAAEAAAVMSAIRKIDGVLQVLV
jgi:cysteinyl-tRNA synthetase